MKKRLLLFSIIFTCFSCEKTFTPDEENGKTNGTSTIKLSFTEIKADQMGAERKLLLGASYSWNSGITYNEEYLDEYWIEMSSTFGDAIENHEIIITVKPREDVTTRSASIVIKCNETSNYEIITVTQSNEKFRLVELDGIESLESKLGDGYSTSRIETLVITGAGLTPEDFYYLRDKLTNLKDLDISKTETTTIPSSIFGNESLEKGLYNILRIKLPESVTKIEDYAFTGCTLLTSINIPNSVTLIGDNAFDGCSSLTSITLPNSVKEIGNFAFNKCTLLASINIPDGVKSIGTDVFAFCSSLTSITLPNSIESIGDNAFNSCGITSIVLPYSVTKLGGYAFSGCEKLTSINIPDGIKEIPEHLFNSCEALTTITLPSSVTSIGYYAFIGCEKLTSINISDGVTTIGRGAFMGCKLLPSIIIPNSVTEIGIDAFAFSWRLESITLSEKLEKIEYGTFSQTSLKSIIIPNSVTEIGSHAFYESTSLESAIISDNVTTIGDYAFYKTSLKSITIPAKVKSIGEHTFSGYNFLWAREIKSLAPAPPVLGVDCINEFNLEHIYVPESSVQAYKDANGWKEYSDKIKAIPSPI